MSTDMMSQMDNALDNAQANAEVKGVEILTRAQQKLKDAEDELVVIQAEKRKADELNDQTEEHIKRLQELLKQGRENSKDLGIAIKANLNMIDSLRKDGIALNG